MVEQRVSLASDSVDTSYATALRFLNALPELDDRAILQSSLSTCLAPCTLWLTTVQSWQSSPRKNLHFDPISAGDAEYKKLVMLAFNFSPSWPLACQCFWMAIPCVYLGACMFSCEWPSKYPYLQEKSSLSCFFRHIFLMRRLWSAYRLFHDMKEASSEECNGWSRHSHTIRGQCYEYLSIMNVRLLVMYEFPSHFSRFCCLFLAIVLNLREGKWAALFFSLEKEKLSRDTHGGSLIGKQDSYTRHGMFGEYWIIIYLGLLDSF